MSKNISPEIPMGSAEPIFKRKTLSLAIVLGATSLVASNVSAKGSYPGAIANQCPAAPAVDCSSCHTGGSPSKGNATTQLANAYQSGGAAAACNLLGGTSPTPTPTPTPGPGPSPTPTPVPTPSPSGNVAPVLDSVPGSVSGQVGQQLRLTVTASDANDDRIRIRASGLPSGARFTQSYDSSLGKWAGVLTWTPGDSGTYSVSFQATEKSTQEKLASEVRNTTLSVGSPYNGGGDDEGDDGNDEEQSDRRRSKHSDD
jgi:hypothetical protein